MTDTWGAAPGQTWLGMLPPTTYTPKCPERAVFLTGVEGPAPGGVGGSRAPLPTTLPPGQAPLHLGFTPFPPRPQPGDQCGFLDLLGSMSDSVDFTLLVSPQLPSVPFPRNPFSICSLPPGVLYKEGLVPGSLQNSNVDKSQIPTEPRAPDGGPKQQGAQVSRGQEPRCLGLTLPLSESQWSLASWFPQVSR